MRFHPVLRLAALLALPVPADALTVFQASGATKADLASTIAAFLAAAGPSTTVTWDPIPSSAEFDAIGLHPTSIFSIADPADPSNLAVWNGDMFSNGVGFTFTVPGSASPLIRANVRAFGAVFLDVDLGAGMSLYNDAFPQGWQGVQAPFGQYSFAGFVLDAQEIGITRLTTGLGGVHDLAFLDDVVFSIPIPEPTTGVLVALALAGLNIRARLRRL